MPILTCLADRQETLLSERFHLGGIASMRGFLFKGVGDRAPRRPDPGSPDDSGTDAIGGDLFARVRASVRSPCSYPRSRRHSSLHVGDSRLQLNCHVPVPYALRALLNNRRRHAKLELSRELWLLRGAGVTMLPCFLIHASQPAWLSIGWHRPAQAARAMPVISCNGTCTNCHAYPAQHTQN